MIRLVVSFIFLTILFGCNNSAPQEKAIDQLAKDSIKKTNPQGWAGTYYGTVPNSKSVGLQMQLSLLPSNTYELQVTHLKKDPKDNVVEDYTGEIQWEEDSTTIVLNEIDSISNKFKIQPNKIIYLNNDATPNSGELAEFYVLKKK